MNKYAYKVESKEEFYSCQQYLFKKGYSWVGDTRLNMLDLGWHLLPIIFLVNLKGSEFFIRSFYELKKEIITYGRNKETCKTKDIILIKYKVKIRSEKLKNMNDAY
jgi:hypothetical protein